MTEILLRLCKSFVSYDRAKTEKIGNFFALTWLIFAGPVTYYSLVLLLLRVDTHCYVGRGRGRGRVPRTITPWHTGTLCV